jgi:hypothetical protein
MTAAPRMVKLADLWQRKSAKGAVYFSGYLGPCQLLLFKDGKKPHPTKPDEEIIVWKLLIQEKDPERRPQRKERPPAAEAERGRQTAGALDQRAAAWNSGERLETTPIPPDGDEIPF